MRLPKAYAPARLLKGKCLFRICHDVPLVKNEIPPFAGIIIGRVKLDRPPAHVLTVRLIEGDHVVVIVEEAADEVESEYKRTNLPCYLT